MYDVMQYDNTNVKSLIYFILLPRKCNSLSCVQHLIIAGIIPEENRCERTIGFVYLGRREATIIMFFATCEDPADLSWRIATNGLQIPDTQNAYYEKEKEKAGLWHCATCAASPTSKGKNTKTKTLPDTLITRLSIARDLYEATIVPV